MAMVSHPASVSITKDISFMISPFLFLTFSSYPRPRFDRFLLSLPEKAAVDLANFRQRLDQVTDRAVNTAAAAIDQATNRAASFAGASLDTALPMLEHAVNSLGMKSGGAVGGAIVGDAGAVAGEATHAQDAKERGELKRHEEEEELLLNIMWKE